MVYTNGDKNGTGGMSAQRELRRQIGRVQRVPHVLATQRKRAVRECECEIEILKKLVEENIKQLSCGKTRQSTIMV
jgi:hypothetical protein